jgi:hypothetical protein
MTVSIERDLASVAVVRAHREYRLVLTEHVCADTKLFTVHGEVTRTPTMYSVQIGQDLHVDMPGGNVTEEVLDRFFWRFTNHSCEPNAVLRGRDMVAKSCIEPWQQITFDYDTTEYDMAQPFTCRCGARSCRGMIRGWRSLPSRERSRLLPYAAARLVADEDAARGCR